MKYDCHISLIKKLASKSHPSCKIRLIQYSYEKLKLNKKSISRGSTTIFTKKKKNNNYAYDSKRVRHRNPKLTKRKSFTIQLLILSEVESGKANEYKEPVVRKEERRQILIHFFLPIAIS